MPVDVLIGDVSAEITDEDGNSAVVLSKSDLAVRDRFLAMSLERIIELLESIDERLGRMESE